MTQKLLVYPKGAKNVLGVGTTKFYELSKLPTFPKPIYLNGKKWPMYSVEQLMSWVKNLTEATNV